MSKKKIKIDDEDKINPKLINSYLKKARLSMRDNDYIAAVKYYQLAAKCAAKAGDTQKETIFNNRANEIIQEHDIQIDVEAEKSFKKKVKSTTKKTGIKITGFEIWGFILTIIIIILGLSGFIFELLFLPNTLTLDDMYFYWGIGFSIEIVGIVLIAIIYKLFIKPPEYKETKKK
ncbi:MAG: hypothetical protein ACTSPY_06435 [Candidatus Helarchaeota archaeon]